MLGNSITKFLKLDSLISNLTGYVETKIELIKVEVKQDVANGLSQAIVYLLIAFVFALVILFISLGVAVSISNAWGPFAGYGIVAAFYLIIGFILFYQREKMVNRAKKELSKTLNSKK